MTLERKKNGYVFHPWSCKIGLKQNLQSDIFCIYECYTTNEKPFQNDEDLITYNFNLVYSLCFLTKLSFAFFCHLLGFCLHSITTKDQIGKFMDQF